MTMEHSALDRALAALREAIAQLEPPAATDAAIAAAARSIPRRPAGRHAWIAWPLALAATIAAVSILVRTLAPVAPPAADAIPASARAAFTPVVPIAEIEQSGDAVVMPARLPRMTLAQFGVPIDPARADDGVDTELWVRRDGALLAYRFVN
jgi:hypothetical protein